MSSTWESKAVQFAALPLLASDRFPPNPSTYPGNQANTKVRTASSEQIASCANNPHFITNMPISLSLKIDPRQPIPSEIIQQFQKTNLDFRVQFKKQKDLVNKYLLDGTLKFTPVTYQSKNKNVMKSASAPKNKSGRKPKNPPPPPPSSSSSSSTTTTALIISPSPAKKVRPNRIRHTRAVLVMCIEQSNQWANTWKSQLKDWIPSNPPTNIQSWIDQNALEQDGSQLFPIDLDLRTIFRFVSEYDTKTPSLSETEIKETNQKFITEVNLDNYLIRPAIVYLIELWFHVNDRYVLPVIPMANLPRRLRIYMAAIDGGLADAGFCVWNLLKQKNQTTLPTYFELATKCGLGAFLAVVFSHYLIGRDADYSMYSTIIGQCDKISNQLHESCFDGLKYNICDIHNLRIIASKISNAAWPNVQRVYIENDGDVIRSRTSHFSGITYDRQTFKVDTSAIRSQQLYGFQPEFYTNICMDYGIYESIFHPNSLKLLKEVHLLDILFYGHSVTKTKEMIRHVTNYKCKLPYIYPASAVPYLCVYQSGGLLSPMSEIPYHQKEAKYIDPLPIDTDVDPLSPLHYDNRTFEYLVSRGHSLININESNNPINNNVKVHDWVIFRPSIDRLSGEEWTIAIKRYELIYPYYGIYVDKVIPITWMNTIKEGISTLSEHHQELQSIYKLWKAFRCIIVNEADALVTTLQLFFFGATMFNPIKQELEPVDWRDNLSLCLDKLKEHAKHDNQKQLIEQFHSYSISSVSSIPLDRFRDCNHLIFGYVLNHYTKNHLSITPGYVSDLTGHFHAYEIDSDTSNALGIRIIYHIMENALSPLSLPNYISKFEDINDPMKQHRIKVNNLQSGTSSDLMDINQSIDFIREKMDNELWPQVFRLFNLFHPQSNIRYEHYNGTIVNSWYDIDSTTKNAGQHKLITALSMCISSMGKKTDARWLNDLIESKDFTGRPIGELIVSNCNCLKVEEKDLLIQSTARSMATQYVMPVIEVYQEKLLSKLKSNLEPHQFQIVHDIITMSDSKRSSSILPAVLDPQLVNVNDAISILSRILIDTNSGINNNKTKLKESKDSKSSSSSTSSSSSSSTAANEDSKSKATAKTKPKAKSKPKSESSSSDKETKFEKEGKTSDKLLKKESKSSSSSSSSTTSSATSGNASTSSLSLDPQVTNQSQSQPKRRRQRSPSPPPVFEEPSSRPSQRIRHDPDMDDNDNARDSSSSSSKNLKDKSKNTKKKNTINDNDDDENSQWNRSMSGSSSDPVPVDTTDDNDNEES